MITLTAKIELSGAYSNLLSVASTSLVDNAEDTEVNYFIIGESRLGEGAVFGSVSSGAKTEIIINQRNLISLESSIFDRSDIKLPSWGIISNRGRLEFNDPYGDVKVLAEQNLLTSNQKVQIYLNDTLSYKSEKIADFYTSDWDYDTNNKKASVNLVDGTQKLQDLNSNEIKLEYYEVSAYNLLYNKLISEIGRAGFNLVPSYWDAKTIDILNNTTIKYPYLNGGTLWAQLQKICEICGLYMYVHPKTRNTIMVSHEFRG